MLDSKLKLGVLVSGNGTNLQAILETCKKGSIGAETVVVISNDSKAFALKRAEKFKIPTAIIPDTRDAETEILKILKNYQVDLVCLAGFMRLLSSSFLKVFSHRVINIHPALLPSFPGLNAQKKAFDYGVKIAGATVHFVDEGCDTGAIILQEAVAVEDDDTEKTLREKILQVEHKIYPKAIALIATKRLKIIGRRVLKLGGR